MSIDREKIKKAKETLGDACAEIIASEAPIIDYDTKNRTGKSLWRPNERTPSMVWCSDKQFFKDFSSGNTMDYIQFAIKYHNLSFAQAVKELFDLVGFEYDESEFKESINEDFFKNYRFPVDEPENDRLIVEEYSSRRSISKETLDLCNVKQDAHGNVSFQFYDTNDILVGTKYRLARSARKEDSTPKWWWQKNADNCPILYGVNKIDSGKPLLIVEGMYDRLSCVQAGYTNTVSIPGGANSKDWIDFNYDFLEKIPEIILWFDDDEVGKKSVKECVNRLGIYKTKIVEPDQDVKKLIKEYYEKYGSNIDKMDANNVLVVCGESSVLKLISQAKEIPNPKLKKLFSYDEIELSNLPYVSTGFKAVDKVLYGNFENNLVVLSGYSGAGKSTMISEMGIIAPLEAGKKIMIFSGEANGGTLLGNTLRPLAGRNHILEYDNSHKGIPNGYSVAYDAKDAIKKFYFDEIWNYEDGEEISTNATEVLNAMEYAYKRHGVSFFTLDNLMCITCNEAAGEDKYSAQIKFALSLKRFTRKYPVTVILVAHPKKPMAGQITVDLYGIAGSSEIINLADRGFAVGILKDDPEGYNSYLSIIKDRQSAKVGTKIKMFYDYPTGRIYSDDSELNKKYSWEESFKPNYDEYTRAKLVCNSRKIKSDGKEDVLGTLDLKK